MKRLHLVLVAILALLFACGTPRRGAPLTGVTAPETEKVLRGQQQFQRHCDQCHPGGESGVGPAINNKALPPFMIRMQVRTGMGAMPSFSKEQLKADELEDVIAYLKALRHRPCCRKGETAGESARP